MSQKPNLEYGTQYKLKHFIRFEGQFILHGNPYILATHNKVLSPGLRAVFYRVKDDYNLSNPIVQKNLKLTGKNVNNERFLYLQNIIVSNGNTFLFFAKRKGNNVNIYVQNLDEGFKIDVKKADKVMSIALEKRQREIHFTVRQSPDQTKILLISMTKKKDKKPLYTAKVYDGEMHKMYWTSKFNANECREETFKGGQIFNSGINTDNYIYNWFLVSNSGRMFFLSNNSANKYSKLDCALISFDDSGRNKHETDLIEPGVAMGGVKFILNKKGNAQIYWLYNSEINGEKAGINALQVVEYDGNTTNVLKEYVFEESEIKQFLPGIKNNLNSKNNLIGYYILNIHFKPNGDSYLIFDKPDAMVGIQDPLLKLHYGFITVLEFDSNYMIKNFQSFMKGNSYTTGRFFPFNVSSSLIGNKLHLVFLNNFREIVWAELEEDKDPVISKLGGFSKKEKILPTMCMYHDKRFLIPAQHRGRRGSVLSLFYK